MKLIVGLGNPGEKYTPTRHNVGFLALDLLEQTEELKSLLTDKQAQFKERKKVLAEVTKARLGGEDVWLVRPQTFMNSSGEVVQKLISYYQIDPLDIIVVHDDVDLDLGVIRIQKNRGAGGHNGVQSIIDSLGTKDFTRVRIGVGRPPEGMETDKYVLGRFSEEEKKAIEKAIQEGIEEIRILL